MTEKINYTVPVYKGKSLEEFSRLSDVWIKFVLASPEHQRYLIDLLNAIFEEEMPPCMEKEEKVTAIRFLDREQVREHLNERGAVLDIRSTSSLRPRRDSSSISRFTSTSGPALRTRACLTLQDSLPPPQSKAGSSPLCKRNVMLRTYLTRIHFPQRNG